MFKEILIYNHRFAWMCAISVITLQTTCISKPWWLLGILPQTVRRFGTLALQGKYIARITPVHQVLVSMEPQLVFRIWVFVLHDEPFSVRKRISNAAETSSALMTAAALMSWAVAA